MQVPYIGLRGFSAFMGSITVPIVYATMRESGYPIAIAAFSALLIAFGESATLPLPFSCVGQKLTMQTMVMSSRPD